MKTYGAAACAFSSVRAATAKRAPPAAKTTTMASARSPPPAKPRCYKRTNPSPYQSCDTMDCQPNDANQYTTFEACCK